MHPAAEGRIKRAVYLGLQQGRKTSLASLSCWIGVLKLQCHGASSATHSFTAFFAGSRVQEMAAASPEMTARDGQRISELCGEIVRNRSWPSCARNLVCATLAETELDRTQNRLQSSGPKCDGASCFWRCLFSCQDVGSFLQVSVSVGSAVVA